MSTNKTNPLGNLLGTIGLIGSAYYLVKKEKPVFTIIIGSLAGGVAGYLLGNAVYKFYTFDKSLTTKT